MALITNISAIGYNYSYSRKRTFGDPLSPYAPYSPLDYWPYGSSMYPLAKENIATAQQEVQT